MPYAAISYRVLPGYEDELASVFDGFRRVDTPEFSDETGRRVGRLLGTAVFLKDDVLVRVIHYEGDFSAIARHMANQSGVHVVEEKIEPYLRDRRDTSTEAGFVRFFRDATMRCILQIPEEAHPGEPDRSGEG